MHAQLQQYLIGIAVFLVVALVLAVLIHVALEYRDARNLRASFRVTLAKFQAGEWIAAVGFNRQKRLTYKPPVPAEPGASDR